MDHLFLTHLCIYKLVGGHVYPDRNVGSGEIVGLVQVIAQRKQKCGRRNWLR